MEESLKTTPQQVCHRCMSHVTTFLPFLKLCKQSAAHWTYLSERLIDISGHSKATTAFIFVTENHVRTVLKRRDKRQNLNLKNVKTRLNRIEKETKRSLETLRKPESLQELKSRIWKAKLYTCQECGSEYKKLCDINLHLANRNKRLCKHCHKVVDLKTFWEHLRTHAFLFFKCDVCALPFEYEAQLEKHKDVHKGRNMCAECKRTFPTPDILTLHVHRRHQPDSCNGCDRKFSNRICLYKHRSKCKSKSPKRYVCDHCYKEFSDRSVIKTHITLVHSKKLLHQCEQCGKQFNSACHLEEHYETHEVILDRFICQYCNKIFSSSGGYRRHMRLKHYSVNPELKREAKYSCEVCQRHFVSEKNLNNHLKAKKHKIQLANRKAGVQTKGRELADINTGVDIEMGTN